MESKKKLNVTTGSSIQEVIRNANSLNVSQSEFTTITQTKDGGTFILIYYR